MGEPEVWPSTASSVPTELCSTRTTSSATGGSTLTAPPPRISTHSTTRSRQSVKPSLGPPPMSDLVATVLLLSTVLVVLLLTTLPAQEMLLSMKQEQVLAGGVGGWGAGGTTGDRAVREGGREAAEAEWMSGCAPYMGDFTVGAWGGRRPVECVIRLLCGKCSDRMESIYVKMESLLCLCKSCSLCPSL